MKITLNGEPREVRAGSLAEMLADLGLGEARVATAVNGDFVPATQRAGTALAEDDRVEIVAPQQGG